MDLTQSFRVLIKTASKTDKLVNDTIPTKGTKTKNVGKKESTLSHFSEKARRILETITDLREELVKNLKEYVNDVSVVYLVDGNSPLLGMTDGEKDAIDQNAQSCIKACNEAIQMLRQMTLKANSIKFVGDQQKLHEDAVLSLLSSYLRHVTKIYGEMRAIRVKRMMDQKRLSRLDSHAKFVDKQINIRVQNGHLQSNATKLTKLDLIQPENEPSINIDDDISPEEKQEFELENENLFQEMTSLTHEVKQVETNIIEVSRLQQVFSEKVLEQETEIDSTLMTTVGSTENIRAANQEIRSAMKNDASFRVWILFFLVVLSLSLLFLDWYNP